MRYILKQSKNKAGWWLATDTTFLVTIIFKEHDFNQSQRVEVLERSKLVQEPVDLAKQLARVVREITDWLIENHSDIL